VCLGCGCLCASRLHARPGLARNGTFNLAAVPSSSTSLLPCKLQPVQVSRLMPLPMQGQRLSAALILAIIQCCLVPACLCCCPASVMSACLPPSFLPPSFLLPYLAQTQALPQVAHVLQLERWLMEGAYNKVLAASKASMASDLHATLIGQLTSTVK